MLQVRIIPCLLMRDEGLVKTIKFNDYKYIGDPINALKIYNEKEVDELIYLDIDASKKNQEPNFEFLKHLASECFMPLTYGGGVKNLNQIENILKIGFEKIVINSSFLTNPELAISAAKEFGSSTIIGAIDYKKNIFGKKYIYNHVTNKNQSLLPLEQAKILEGNGVGEIFLNSVDRDGMYLGYDLELVSELSSQLSIPLIACGGASNYDDFNKVIKAGASAAAAGSVFVYQGPHRAVLISYPFSSMT